MFSMEKLTSIKLKMVAASQICCLFVMMLPFMFLNSGCKGIINNNQQERKVNDSIQTLIDAYYSAEDVLAYAYMNCDLNYSMHVDYLVYDNNMKNLEDKNALDSFKRFVYIPKSACSSCVRQLCKLLDSKDIIDKCLFVFPYKKTQESELIINEACIPPANIMYLKGEIGLPIENENVVFMFTKSQDGKINNIFVPDKNLENLSEIYLDITTIKEKGTHNIKPYNNNKNYD